MRSSIRVIAILALVHCFPSKSVADTDLPNLKKSNYELCRNSFLPNAVGGYKSFAEREPLAYVPGFKVPTEFAIMKSLSAKCASAISTGPFRLCRSGNEDVIEYWDEGQLLGQMKVSLPTDGESSAWVSEIQVQASARGQGISRLIFEKMVELAGPSLSRVVGNMAHTNFEVILKEYYAISSPDSPRFVPNLTKLEANVRAVSVSPFVRALRKLGFTEITQASFDWTTINGPPYISQIMVTVSKPGGSQ